MREKKKCRLKIFWEKSLEIEIKNEMNSSITPENLKLYRYWRTVQRDQLGLSANLFMVFASAILGFVINFLVTKKCETEWFIKVPLLIGILLLLCSLFIYTKFTENRLYDFRSTAQLLRSGEKEEDVNQKTSCLGEKTWELYFCQKCFLIAGSLVSIFVFCIYIFLS